MTVNIRSKGQRGEREAAELVMSWAAPVLDHLGLPALDVTRNLQQSRSGGYDLIGIDWLALEVKRHETLQVSQWWKQALRQAKEDQIPMLLYRQNRTPWKARLMVTAQHPRDWKTAIPVDVDLESAKMWFQGELYGRLR